MNSASADMEVVTITARHTGVNTGDILSFWSGGGRRVPGDPSNFDFLQEIRGYNEPKEQCENRNHLVERKFEACRLDVKTYESHAVKDCADNNGIQIFGVGISALAVGPVGADISDFDACRERVASEGVKRSQVCNTLKTEFSRPCH